MIYHFQTLVDHKLLSKNNVAVTDGEHLTNVHCKFAHWLLDQHYATPSLISNKVILWCPFPVKDNITKNYVRHIAVDAQRISVFKIISVDGTRIAYYSPLDVFHALRIGILKPFDETTFYAVFSPRSSVNETTNRRKVCVNCGVYFTGKAGSHSLTKHHVVPKAYARYLSSEEQQFLHDLLYLCRRCHELAEAKLDNLKIKMGELCGCPHTSNFGTSIPENNIKYNLAKRILRADENKEKHIENLKKLLNKEELTASDLDECLLLPTYERSNEPNHFEEVVKYWANDKQAFFKKWRTYFIDSMNPLYMPLDFDVSAKR